MSGSTWSKVVTKTCYTGRCWIVVGGLKGGRLGGWDSCELLRSRDGNLMSLGGKFYVAGKNPRLCVRKINEKRSGWLSGGRDFFESLMQNIWMSARYFLTRVSSKYRAPLRHETWNSRFSDGVQLPQRYTERLYCNLLTECESCNFHRRVFLIKNSPFCFNLCETTQISFTDTLCWVITLRRLQKSLWAN